MEIKSSYLKGILIVGIIVISIIAMALDFSNGKEVALIGLGGLIGLTKGE